MVVVQGTAGTAGVIIAPVMAVVQDTAGTTAAIIVLLMATVPGIGTRSTGIFALAVEINNSEIRPDNFTKSALTVL